MRQRIYFYYLPYKYNHELTSKDRLTNTCRHANLAKKALLS